MVEEEQIALEEAVVISLLFSPKLKEGLQEHQGAIEPEGTCCKTLKLRFKIAHGLALQPLGV